MREHSMRPADLRSMILSADLMILLPPSRARAGRHAAGRFQRHSLDEYPPGQGDRAPIVFLPDVTGKTGSNFEDLVVFDPELGCLANPPREEPEPFTKCLRKIRRDRERLADAAEELRSPLRGMYTRRGLSRHLRCTRCRRETAKRADEGIE